MRRFFRGIGLCAGVMALLCGSAVLIGRAPPQGDLIPDLHICNDKPCYLGIVPGKTTMNQVFALADQLPIQTTTFDYSVTDLTGIVSSIQFYPSPPMPGGIIGTVAITPRDGSISSIDVIAHWGPPCGISRYNDHQQVVFSYPDMAFFFPTTDWVLKPSFAARIIFFANDRPCQDFIKSPNYIPWRGFTSYR